MKAWVALISRFDSRGVRPPSCLQQIPYAELIAADWELPHPDMLIWIWQAARYDSSPCLIARPHAEFTPPDDFRGMIRSLRTDSADRTDIGAEYTTTGRECGLPENFGLLSMSGKLEALNARLIEPTRILRSLDLGGKRNTLMAFSGSLRPSASGMQSYLYFCKFGLSPHDSNFLNVSGNLLEKSDFSEF